jgi:hypothetical protein
MSRKAGRRKRISAEVVVLKTVRFTFWITSNSGILGSGCQSCRRELLTKTGRISLLPPFTASFFLQLLSSQIDMAEACGSRTQTIDSQLATTDDAAASAGFPLDSIGVRTVHLPRKLCLIHRGLRPCSFGPCFSDRLRDVRLGEQLLVAQCHHGVYPHRTPGRDVTGRQRHEQEHNNDKHHR